MQAKDVMTPKIISVTPETRVQEIARLLIDNRISAVPVVDASGKALGVVSEGDLVRRGGSETEAHPSWWLRLFESPEEQARDYARSHGQTASDVMTSPAVTVAETASVAEIAEILERRRIKRVFVESGGTLAGVVSRANLIQALALQREIAQPPRAADDRVLRERIIDAIHDKARLPAAFLNVLVRDGKAELWGAAHTESEKRAIRIAAEEVAGRGNVADHIGVLDAQSRRVLWAE